MACDDESVGRWIDQILRRMDPERYFRKIFDCFFQPLTFFLQGLFIPPEDRRDLAQETLIRAFGRLSSFRGESKFSTWLFRIARNLANNYWRDRSTAKRSATEVSTAALEDIGLEVADGDLRGEPLGDPLREAQKNEETDLLLQAISRLPPKMRQCVLHTLEGRSQKEIAFLTGSKEGTVKAHMSQARTRLREILEELMADRGGVEGVDTAIEAPQGKAPEDDASVGDATGSDPAGEEDSEDAERRES